MRSKIILIFFCLTCFLGVDNKCLAAAMPDYVSIVLKLKREYVYEGNPMYFSKRKEGWFVYQGTGYDPKKEQLYWSAATGTYQKLSYAVANSKTNNNGMNYFIIDKDLIADYNLMPYFGYPGYEDDVIKLYEGRNNLSLIDKEILAKACKRFTEKVLWIYAPKRSNEWYWDDISTDSIPLITEDKINRYISAKNKELELLKEIKKVNPAYQLDRINISLAIANQSMLGWLYMQMAGKGEQAKAYLKDNLYADNEWDIIARQTIRPLPANAVYFATTETEALAIWYLQEKENLRSDLVVINADMLDNGDYISLIQEGFGKQKPLALSFGVYYIKHLMPYRIHLNGNKINDEFYSKSLSWEDLKTQLGKQAAQNNEKQNVWNGPTIQALNLRIDVNWWKVKRRFRNDKNIEDYGPSLLMHYTDFDLYRHEIILLELINQLQWSRFICLPAYYAGHRFYLKDYLTLCGTYAKIDLPSYERENLINSLENPKDNSTDDSDNQSDGEEEGSGEEMEAADSVAVVSQKVIKSPASIANAEVKPKMELMFYIADTLKAIDCIKQLKPIKLNHKLKGGNDEAEICIENLRDAAIDVCKHLNGNFSNEQKESLLKKSLELADNDKAPFFYSGLSAADLYLNMGNKVKARQLINIVLDNVDNEYISNKKSLAEAFHFTVINEILNSAATLADAMNDKPLQERIRQKIKIVGDK